MESILNESLEVSIEIRPYLVVIYPKTTNEGESTEERFEIEEENVILGSAASVPIRLSHPAIKPEHARIYHHGDTWWFTDLTDTFHVSVDGLIVRLFPMRQDGFSFHLGPLLCRFFLGTSSQSQYEQRLYETAHIDALTHVANRTVFARRLRQEMARCVEQEKPLSLLMMDLDHFNQFNNNHGHQAGDKVLREIAWRVLQQLRKTELLARLGGDEFAILLPNTSTAQANEVAQRICKVIAQEPVMYKDEALSVTASIGCITTEESMDLDEFVKKADDLLYAGKRAGRNQAQGA